MILRIMGRSLGMACAMTIMVSAAGAQTKPPASKPDAGSNSATHPAATAKKKWCIGCSVDGKTTPRTADGHPNLSGYWVNPRSDLMVKGPDGSVYYDFGAGPKNPRALNGVTFNGLVPQPSQPEYKPEYADKVKKILANAYGPSTPEDPQYDCKPMGVPRSHVPPLQIIQTPELVAIMYESNFIGQTSRLIYTDGRPHPEDLENSFLGHSIGHWEGDTLVVDVVGLNDETWLGGGQATEKMAILHSDQEHVVERYTRNGDILTYEATVEDPVVLAKPWVITPRKILHGGPEDDLYESFCVGRDKSHIVKPTAQDPGK